ncbi:MAG: hypothetical protein M1824_005948 [Vezdaea acicularis]|nr:MAG: hypothetical protein M1824_005948 [Vezdaea acicularis]
MTATRRQLVPKPAGYWKNRSKELVGHQAKGKDHADPTKKQIERTKQLWDRFCSEIEEESDEHLKTAGAEDFKTFLEWVMDGNIKITAEGTILGCWNLLLMAYTKLTSGEIVARPVTQEIRKFIHNDIVERYGLSTVRQRPLDVLSSLDLFKLLHYHWCFDDNVFLHERYRIQQPLITQLLVYAVGRPGAIVESSSYRGTNEVIKYKDIQLSLLKNSAGERDVLVLEMTFWLLKGRRGESRRTEPVKFVFHERDDHLAFCPILLFLALAFADEAFEDVSSPEALNRIRVPPCREAIQFRWKNSMLNIPIFRQTESTVNGPRISPTRALPASDYAAYLGKLSLSAGLERKVTPYCLRRGGANAIEPVATTAQRNQIMGHARADVFKHYISQTVAVDTQSAYLGTPARKDLMQAVGHMSATRDPRVPKKLTDDQKAEIARDVSLSKLRKIRDELSGQLRLQSGKIKLGKGTSLYQEYQNAHKDYRSRRMVLAREKLVKSRETFFANINGLEIRQQLAGLPQYREPDPLTEISYHFLERAKVVKAFYGDEDAQSETPICRLQTAIKISQEVRAFEGTFKTFI